MKRGGRFFSGAALLSAGLAFGASWYIGSESAAPAPRHIGAPPADLPIESVTIPSGSGSQLAGWFIPGEARKGAILLLHGVRANRLEMLGRARFFHRLGFAVLLF